MKTTATFAFPYPEPPDHTRTWEYWQGLAEAVDTMLATKTAYLRADGTLGLTTAGVTRPIPFAFQLGGLSFTFSGARWAQQVITFAANRFTLQPVWVATLGSSGSFNVGQSALTATSVTAVAMNIDEVASSGPVYGTWMAAQAAPGSSYGLAAGSQAAAVPAEGTAAMTAVCHTDGCDNAGIPIAITVPTLDPFGQPLTEPPPVACGVCMQPITDLVAAA